MKILVVVDMQNDFLTGTLGSEDTKEIIPNVIKSIENFNGKIFFTRDTHFEDYLNTQEGEKLPVKHCLKNTWGWEICEELKKYTNEEHIVDKPTFGSVVLAEKLVEINDKEKIDSVTFVGVCTDICVIANAMLVKSFLPEVKVIVDSSSCAGVSKKTHEAALTAMQSCQIEIA
jgi:nicotinamidase-related amidase